MVSLAGAHDRRRAQSADEEVAERLVVRQAVEDLPDPRRTIVFLAFWEDLSHAEIAETVGLPLGTVKSHVRRGLIELHQQLEGVRHESTLTSSDLAGLALDPTDGPRRRARARRDLPRVRRPASPRLTDVRRRAGGDAAGARPPELRAQVLARGRGRSDARAACRSAPDRAGDARRGVPLWLAGVAAALALLAGVGLGASAPGRTTLPERSTAGGAPGPSWPPTPHRPRQRRRARRSPSAVQTDDTFTHPGQRERARRRARRPRGLADQRRRQADGRARPARRGRRRGVRRAAWTSSTRATASSTSPSSPTTATPPTPG